MRCFLANREGQPARKSLFQNGLDCHSEFLIQIDNMTSAEGPSRALIPQVRELAIASCRWCRGLTWANLYFRFKIQIDVIQITKPHDEREGVTVEVTECRRDLHRWPEVGFTEFATAARIISQLKGQGYAVKWGAEASDLEAVLGLPPADELEKAARDAIAQGADAELVASLGNGGTGIVAEITGRYPGPMTALRFDMDALPIGESPDSRHIPAAKGFRSEREGYMHACGHDGHVAIGLALAQRLADKEFPGTVRLIFQAAEEGARGAAPLVKGGAVDGIDRLLSLHLGLGLPVGTLAAGSTGFFANSKLKARFTGRAAHAAAAPDQGRNALLGAATALLMIHALPRFAAAPTRVNVGVLKGGTAPNIIAETAELLLELRATDGETNAELLRRVQKILNNAADMHELQVDIEEIGRATTAVCDPELVSEVARAAKSMSAYPTVVDSHDVGVSEDATLLMRAVQDQGGRANYFVVGASSPGPHHSQLFDIAEAALPPAVDLLELIVRNPESQPIGQTCNGE